MRPALLFLALVACAGSDDPLDTDVDADPDTDADTDTDTGPRWWGEGDPFADELVSFEPGPFAGFGQDALPDVVLGAPIGGGQRGSLDVVSLGEGGSIVLGFDETIVDGPGIDLLVFENAFVGWPETGEVAVSEDGETWVPFPCDALDREGGFPGCAGVNNVWSTPDNGIDPTDPEAAGGDAFDLADVGVARARFVRITDTGANAYEATNGGFDLDAVAIVNGEPAE